MYARYLEKTGPSYHSISFRVADAPSAQARCKEKGILINTEGPGLIFLHPKSTGGLIMELTDHMMPNDPWDLPHWRRDWAAGRPHKPHALAHVVCAPRQPGAAIEFLVEALDGAAYPPAVVAWPEPATATRVDVADASLVILEPVDREKGPLARFANGPNGGVYALAWQVGDAKAAAEWFAGNEVTIDPLPAETGYSHAVMLDGARHWFVGPAGA
jgi:4-hydroxyphenylpyruvate dioxygenase-like putative hemolysin